MTTVVESFITLPGSAMGRDNPLPDLAGAKDMHADVKTDASVSAEERRHMGAFPVSGILPYLIQDGYDRRLKPIRVPVVVLENAKIKATFVPQWGGRLWSLVDKVKGRELLHKNPVFQPCNLALRNAWISGGVEWNCGIIGHTPFTVDKLFAEIVTLSGGTKALRMYEYERVRGIAFRIEAFLPDGSDRLFVRVKMENTRETPTACYWWSNIAVDEAPDRRVLVPAKQCFRHGYGGAVAKVDVPVMTMDASHFMDEAKAEVLKEGGERAVDTSYAARIPHAMDFFYDIKDGQRPFVAVVDETGYGLVQCSTHEQKGRKLFVWGMNAGGRHWQRFLSRPGQAYIEVQAGLAKTQLEHLPMAPYQAISWLESYGPLSVDPETAHGADYEAAFTAAEKALDEVLPLSTLQDIQKDTDGQLNTRRGRMIARGSAWALAEYRLVGRSFRAGNLSFEGKPGKAEAFFMRLVDKKALSHRGRPRPTDEPLGYQTGPEWLALMREVAEKPQNRHWSIFYHLGVMEAKNGNAKQALAAFMRSRKLSDNPWSARCMALLARQAGDTAACHRLYREALALLPHRAIAMEALGYLTDDARAEEALQLFDSLPVAVQRLGRAQLYRARALTQAGRPEEALAILETPLVVPDVREGELSLSHQWQEAKLAQARIVKGSALSATEEEQIRQTPPPDALDFRMR